MSAPEDWRRGYEVMRCINCSKPVGYISAFGDDADRAEVLENLDHVGDVMCFECAAKELTSFCKDMHDSSKTSNPINKEK